MLNCNYEYIYLKSINFIRNDFWNNLAFSPKETEVLNKGTYLINLIVLVIQASLKKILYKINYYKFIYIIFLDMSNKASLV